MNARSHTAPAVATPATRGGLVMLVYPRAEVLDIAGPLDILCAAAPGDDTSAPLLVSRDGGPVATWPSSITIMTAPLGAAGRHPIDTLLVPGGDGSRAAAADARTIAWLRRAARRARRVVGICTGAFLLARAGLLDGRRATTHWRHVDALADGYPQVQVEPDAIFVEDGNVYTSAGITAGMDLALHLVERDCGAGRALAIARDWLLYVKRPGGQSQFSALLPECDARHAGIGELCAWIVAHPEAAHGVEALAARVAMSPRHFARVFRAETGMTPARFVETVRLETARRWLEQGTRSLERVARLSGLRDPEHLRRAFVRRLGVSPSDYRDRFEHARGGRDLHPSVRE